MNANEVIITARKRIFAPRTAASRMSSPRSRWSPIHDRRTELFVALVDFLRKLVTGTDLGDYVLADREKGLQQRIVELQDFHGAFVAQLAQRKRVVRVELRQGARVFARGHGLDDSPVARVEAFPHGLVDANRIVGAGLVKPGIIIIARRIVQAEGHVEPGADEFAGVKAPDLSAGFGRAIHVGDAGPYRVEGFERAHQRTGWIHLDFDTPSGREADCLRETNCAGLKTHRRPGGGWNGPRLRASAGPQHRAAQPRAPFALETSAAGRTGAKL
jgi:hypothetical protein